MQSIRVTLYEILGYFVPGFLASLGVAAGIWSIWFHSASIEISQIPSSPRALGCTALFAYILGHLVQATGNFLPRAESRYSLHSSCQGICELTASAMESELGICLTDKGLPMVSALSQCLVSQTGKADDQEVYTYREGFYRGACVAMLLGGLALLIRSFSSARISRHGIITPIPTSLVVSSAIASLTSAWLFYLRYVRFGDYRVRTTLGAALVVIKTINPKEKAEDK